MNKTSTRILLLFAAFALFIVPVVALAAAGFDDVDDDNVFVADIQWMKDNEITKGCNPPTNTNFCPDKPVTRQQMAAFMHRLAVSRVVDAATAADADMLDGLDSTAFLGKTEKAANSNKLDGKHATALMSIAGSVVNEGFTITIGGGPEVVTSLTGFDVPTGGGVITATVTSTFDTVGLQLGLVWPVIDGTCADDVSDGGVGFYFTDGVAMPIGEISGSIAGEVASGTHRVDVCTVAAGSAPTDLVSTRLNVVWSPVASAAGVASSSGRTAEELLARYSGLLEN